MMSVVYQTLITLQKELSCLESKARRTCKKMGSSNAEDLALLLPYLGGDAEVLIKLLMFVLVVLVPYSQANFV